MCQGYERVKIVSLKHDGSFHRSWEENTVLEETKEGLIGMNNRTMVVEADGTRWLTEEPAIFYFYPDKWFNVIVLFTEDDYSFYCNVSSSYRKEGQVLSYIDYDVDLIVSSDLRYRFVDVDEFIFHRKKYSYPSKVVSNVQKASKQIVEAITKKADPFNASFVEKWKRYL